MRKLLLPVFILLAVLFSVFSSMSIATERPPIDFSDRPLKLWVPYDPKKPGDIYSLKDDYIFIDQKDLQEIEDAKKPDQN